MGTDLNLFSGQRVVLTPMLTQIISTIVQRTWRERLLTRPWRPWKATKVVSRVEPSDTVLQVDGKLLMHPATFERLKMALEAKR